MTQYDEATKAKLTAYVEALPEEHQAKAKQLLGITLRVGQDQITWDLFDAEMRKWVQTNAGVAIEEDLGWIIVGHPPISFDAYRRKNLRAAARRKATIARNRSTKAISDLLP